MTILLIIGYLVFGWGFVGLFKTIGVNPVALDDWDEPMEDDNFLNGYLILFWPAFMGLWVLKLVVWYPIKLLCILLGMLSI